MGVQEFERFSECEGGVLECCRKGAFIMPENGEKAFAYKDKSDLLVSETGLRRSPGESICGFRCV